MSGKKVSRNAMRLLTTRQILQASEGDHADGAGLYLRVRGVSASWVYRYTAVSGKRREMGLGKVDRSSSESVSRDVGKAREDAEAARKLIAVGQDPIDARSANQVEVRQSKAAVRAAVKAGSLTLARAARAYHERFVEPHLSVRHAATWISSLESHIPPPTWHKPIADVDAGELLDILLDLYAAIPETASRVRQRLEVVFDDALLRGFVTTNPAAVIRRNLSKVSKRQKVEHYRSLPYSEAQMFFATLEGQPGTAAQALRLLMLTASRTGEIVGAVKSEFDLEAATWRIDGSRMKAGEEHNVYLSQPALTIVRQLVDDPSNITDWLFPSPTGSGQPLSNMAMLVLLKRMKVHRITTAHGLRSTFSTWANESGRYRVDVIEACLAHQEANKVRAAYNRAKFADERRSLLSDWAAFCSGYEASVASQCAEEATSAA